MEVGLSVPGATMLIMEARSESLLTFGAVSPTRGVEPVDLGLAALDWGFGGMWPGQLWVITGHRGAGRNMLALQLARHADVVSGASTHLVSPLLSPDEVVAMLVAGQGRVPLQHLRSGRLTEQDRTAVTEASRELAAAPLTVDVVTPRSDGAEPEAVLGSTMARLLVVDDVDVWAGGRLTSVMRMLRTYAEERAATVVVTAPRRPVFSAARRFRRLCDRIQAVVVDLDRPDTYRRESTRPGCLDVTFFPDSATPTTKCVALQGHYARMVDIERPALAE